MAYVIVFVDDPQMAHVAVDSADCAHEIVATLVACGVRAVVTDEAGAAVTPAATPAGRAQDLPVDHDEPDPPGSSWWC